MGRAHNQLIAAGQSCEVKGCNTMTIRGCRTQPLMIMAIQITHKQEEERTSSTCMATIDHGRCQNLVILVRVEVKAEDMKVLSLVI